MLKWHQRCLITYWKQFMDKIEVNLLWFQDKITDFLLKIANFMENIENIKIFQVPHLQGKINLGGKFPSGNEFAHSAVPIDTNFTILRLLEPPFIAVQSQQKFVDHPVE